MTETLPFLIPIFFVTAFLYSIVGFGGGSTYLAVLAFFAVPYESIPKIALLCNLVVVSGGCYFFIKEGHFSFRKVLPFVVSSIPFAYWAGGVVLNKEKFITILAITLGFAGGRMLLSFKEFETKPELRWQHAWLLGIPIGAVLGGISGLVGIGGGIFLLPILSFLGWAHAKEGAAAASFFILVNSLSGLIGQFSKSDAFIGAVEIAPLALAVFVGGQIGSRVGSGKLPKIVMQRIAGFLIFAVSMRMLWRLVITQ